MTDIDLTLARKAAEAFTAAAAGFQAVAASFEAHLTSLDSTGKIADTTPKPEPEKETAPEPELTLVDVRTVLAEKTRDGHGTKIREILAAHGAKKLTELDPSLYGAVKTEAEAL